jgi:uncharacterized damage-inducible protein DinB
MKSNYNSLAVIYEGWNGYNTSLIRAISPLSPDQLSRSAGEDRRSVGEIASHISFGRVGWFSNMDAPGSRELAGKLEAVGSEQAIATDPKELVKWLGETWKMIELTLCTWTIEDLATTYRHAYDDKIYAVSRQWTIWRIMAHDIHHGGQITTLLSLQGIEPFELALLGGHITEPMLADVH